MGYLHKSIVKRLSNNYGFTLIEIIIVLIITGLMVALALPNFNKTIGRYNLDSSSRALVIDIRTLEQAAIKYEDAGFEIQFVSNETYKLIYFVNNAYVTQKTVKLPSSIRYNSNSTSNNIKNNYNTLVFQANGRPIGGIGGHICLEDHINGKLLYIIIDTLGRVRVSETLL